jgi:hypothetical protein
MLQAVASIYPEVGRKILNNQATDRLGSSGSNLFYCHSYMAPQHVDDDCTPCISVQLDKNKCGEDDYNFAYTEWGISVITARNVMWFV